MHSVPICIFVVNCSAFRVKKVSPKKSSHTSCPKFNLVQNPVHLYWDWLYCEAEASALSLSSFLMRSVATRWWLLLLLWPIWFVLNASIKLDIWRLVLFLSTLSKVVSYALQSTAISNIYLGTTMAGLFWILPKSKVSLQKSMEQQITTTGWSIATEFYNFFLTGTKKQKNPLSQWFL